MRIKCIKCNEKLTMSSVMIYASVNTFNALEETLKKIVIHALEVTCMTAFRGDGDNLLANLANACKMACSKCREYTLWKASPERTKVCCSDEAEDAVQF